MNNINIDIKDTQFKLDQVLIEAQLPIGVAFLIVKDLYHSIEQNYYGYLNKLSLQDIPENLEEKLQKIGTVVEDTKPNKDNIDSSN